MSKALDVDIRDERQAIMILKLKAFRSFRAGVSVFSMCAGTLVDVQQIDHRNRKCLINFGGGLVSWVSKIEVDRDFEVASELTIGNIDEAEFTGKVDPLDTLRRIGKEWLGLRQTCKCVGIEACSVCEITFLLNEAFEVER